MANKMEEQFWWKNLKITLLEQGDFIAAKSAT